MPDGAVRPESLRPTLTRGLVAVVGFTLLFTLLADAPTSGAADLASQIASARRSQIYYESVMRAQDRQVERLKRAKKSARKAVRQARRHVRSVKGRRAAARQRVVARAEHLEHLRQKWSEGSEEEPPAIYLERLEEARVRLASARKSLRRVERRAARAVRSQRIRHRRVAQVRRLTRAAVARQNAAEAGLGAQIVWMTRLAQQRAVRQGATQLGPGGHAFSWPAYGSITQRYGCTGFRLNPRRGSCRHFHDGMDISPDGGSAIRSVAEGVVAYVGWNPWDSEGRAFIIVIGHPDGYHSRYGHLLPRRQVRVGQVVRKGEIIGRMGSTGKSTGVHLHMELLDRSGTVDPLRYLPPRGQDEVRTGPAAGGGKDARKSGKNRGVGSKGRKRASGKSKAGKARKGAQGTHRERAQGARRGSGAGLEAAGAREEARASWVLTWPDPCEPPEAVDSAPGARDRTAIAGLADGPTEALATAIEPDCGAGPVDGSLELALDTDADPIGPLQPGDPRLARAVE